MGKFWSAGISDELDAFEYLNYADGRVLKDLDMNDQNIRFTAFLGEIWSCVATNGHFHDVQAI